MHRQFLLKLLEKHTPYDETERDMLQRMQAFITANANCFDRELEQGHITGSAWLVDKNLNHVFFTHHAKLNRWLQPGGHSDGDANTLAVSMREASEESGIEDVFIQPLLPDIFDIDIHTIPARKNDPEHLHYDVRFILETDMNQPLKISDESNEIAWIEIEKIPEIANDEASILRMLAKMQKLKQQ
ncbi:MAG: NUDIX hydrolase [Gammaproteobacteria bacterium]|nr:NUDIX hydrolase [Gammaproteobacteria bacterium]